MDKEKVIEVMEKGIYYFINMYRIEAQDQEDVFQQCVEKILVSLEQYDPAMGTSINQFLMPRIRGVVKEAVRKSNKSAIPKDDIYAIDPNNIEQGILDEESNKALKNAISKLSKMQKKVIVLKYFYGLSMSEISFGLDIHYSTVAKYHQRGLTTLRKYLIKEVAETR